MADTKFLAKEQVTRSTPPSQFQWHRYWDAKEMCRLCVQNCKVIQNSKTSPDMKANLPADTSTDSITDGTCHAAQEAFDTAKTINCKVAFLAEKDVAPRTTSKHAIQNKAAGPNQGIHGKRALPMCFTTSGQTHNSQYHQ